MTFIASDGANFDPVEADSFVLFAGERFDFIINANQTVDNYWIRFRGLGDCGYKPYSQNYAEAILRYNGAPKIDPVAETGYKAAHRNGTVSL